MKCARNRTPEHREIRAQSTDTCRGSRGVNELAGEILADLLPAGQAAAEFQRILDHPSIVLVDPMAALARLQLARALALSGDSMKAKRAYEDLLELWKNADADTPLVRRARAE